jgi:hypothetical protein
LLSRIAIFSHEADSLYACRRSAMDETYRASSPTYRRSFD